jgi:hypothetical protein
MLIHEAQAIIVPPLTFGFDLWAEGGHEAELDELFDLYGKLVDTYIPIQLNSHPYPNIFTWS